MNYKMLSEKKLGDHTILWKWYFEGGTIELQPGGEYAMVNFNFNSNFDFSFFLLWEENILPVVSELKVVKLTTIVETKKEEAIFKKIGFILTDQEIGYMVKAI